MTTPEIIFVETEPRDRWRTFEFADIPPGARTMKNLRDRKRVIE